MNKRTIFFVDLNYVRAGREWTIIPFPLNVSYIAAFLQKMMPGAFETRLFKNPEKFLEAISSQKPDIAAFSNYIWNKNLQLEFAKHLKKLHPDCITVMGGPNYNFGERAWIENFSRTNQQIDFHIEGEGEVKLFNLAACCVENEMDLAAVKSANPAGVTYIRSQDGQLVLNDIVAGGWSRLEGLNLDIKGGRLRDLNDIPSPYLTGLLDEFLADPNYCPIIETNRGCPYSCTFCNWGDMGKSKSAMFSQERVMEELRFIAEHNVSKTPYIYIGDANFGMFPRDVEIARLLRELKDTRGFPQSVYLYFAKNSSEKVVRIAEILKDMTPISLSRQSQNSDVLKIIKRSNIKIDTFNQLAELAKSLHINSFVELIYALPGESKKSFYAGVKEIMRQRVDGLHMFPAMLLDGSEMGTQISRDRYKIKGEWRLIDGCAGSYGPVNAIEFEEIITETEVMSRNDYFEIRLFHFLQTLFLDTKLYKDTDTLIGDWSLFELIEDVIANYQSAPVPFRRMIEQFVARAKEELLPEPPRTFTSAEVDKSLSGSVKLNPLFIAKLLYEPGIRDAFHVFLKQRIMAIGSATEEDVDNVLQYIDASVYPFDGSSARHIAMSFDAVAFSKRQPFREVRLSDYRSEGPRSFRYAKKFTYQNFIDKMPASLPMPEKIYEVLLHHTHEKLLHTVTWHLESGAIVNAQASDQPLQENVDGSEKREIQLEGGWLY